MRNQMIALLSLFLLSLGSITHAKPTSLPVNPIQADFTEDHLNILLDAKHPSFRLKLKSNPTTGYAWFLREYNANLVLPVKHEYKMTDEKIMGAPGHEYWTFKVKPIGFIVPQQTTLRLVYARPWQGSDSSTVLSYHVTTH